MDPLRHVKPSVRALAAYTLALREAPVKINQNENPWDLPEAVKRRVLERALARPWSRYPDFDPKELLRGPRALLGLARRRHPGRQRLERGDRGAAARDRRPRHEGRHPGADLHALRPDDHDPRRRGGARVAEARSPEARSDVADRTARHKAPAFAYDVEALLESREESQASVTIVCSPNNPTGTSLAPRDVERLCRASDSLVVIDEAYHEFSGETVVPLLERHPNLVVLRTFSKAMALAGLRVGYLLASPELVREINKARLPYNVNFFSQMAAIAALEEKEVLATSVRRLVAERQRLLARLADVPGVRAFPSDANFFLLECLSADPKAVFASMLRRGVLVRDVTSYPMLSRCLRVSVGTEAENDAFLHALGTALTEAGMDLTTGRA